MDVRQFNDVEMGPQIANDDLLDEPIKDTIMRDVYMIGEKLKYVLLPQSRSEKGGILRKWDFWGPLILCLMLSLIFWSQAVYNQKRTVFALVFGYVWAGSALVTLNATLLGCKLSFFQSVCVLGYCLFPMVLGSFICLFIPHILAFLRVIVVGAAMWWSVGASTSFMSSIATEGKEMLVYYPMWLFYTIMGWLVLTM